VAKITLENVTKAFRDDVVAVDRVSLDIADGEFMVLVGPSGCGKSTILRLLAGLEEVTEGTILIGDRDVTDLPPKQRDVAMVFQNYALYPHMTVEENIGFGLRLRRTPKAAAQERVLRAAKTLGLESYLARKPAELSGGQRQRVAMGRAMVREPKAFLMDEPLSNLDAKLRVQMRAELARLHDSLRTTTVYVTHDQVEAMTLGQRVAVLKDGILQQVDTPQALYRAPANLFVAAFIGSPPMNLVEAAIERDTVSFGGWTLPRSDHEGLHAFEGRTVILGIRPSDMEDAEVWRSEALPTIEVAADVTEELGSEVNVLFRVKAKPVVTEDTMKAASDEGDEAVLPLLGEEDVTMFCARVDARTKASPGRMVTLTIDPSRFHYFDPQTGQRVAEANVPQPIGPRDR
jgi:multiple sugar transport system ATP-binding protein